ncbi:hypothetical protein DPEC_G00141940 [Dallia pectoralis]|uniref:Uncharacterized protein n=1 Tax=Dallia pectoralis TaxID=75939 RepID=A0ACC2GMY6_DALPE|nr:hypothetical protein DPEC_G00141940 [Dallia pectoralis]
MTGDRGMNHSGELYPTYLSLPVLHSHTNYPCTRNLKDFRSISVFLFYTIPASTICKRNTYLERTVALSFPESIGLFLGYRTDR